MRTVCSSSSSSPRGVPMVMLRDAWDHLAMGHHPSVRAALLEVDFRGGADAGQAGDGRGGGEPGPLLLLEVPQQEAHDALALRAEAALDGADQALEAVVVLVGSV